MTLRVLKSQARYVRSHPSLPGCVSRGVSRLAQSSMAGSLPRNWQFLSSLAAGSTYDVSFRSLVTLSAGIADALALAHHAQLEQTQAQASGGRGIKRANAIAAGAAWLHARSRNLQPGSAKFALLFDESAPALAKSTRIGADISPARKCKINVPQNIPFRGTLKKRATASSSPGVRSSTRRR